MNPPPAPSASTRAADVGEAALTLFAERGYHGTTMKDLAGAIGVRAPSLYNHIRSKQELLRTIMVATAAAVWSDFERATAGVEDPVAALRQATYVYALRHATHQREALIVNRELASLAEPAHTTVRDQLKAHERAVRAIIERGAAEGSFEVDSVPLATFAILEMAVSVARWYDPAGELSTEQVAAAYAEFAVRSATAR